MCSSPEMHLICFLQVPLGEDHFQPASQLKVDWPTQGVCIHTKHIYTKANLLSQLLRNEWGFFLYFFLFPTLFGRKTDFSTVPCHWMTGRQFGLVILYPYLRFNPWESQLNMGKDSFKTSHLRWTLDICLLWSLGHLTEAQVCSNNKSPADFGIPIIHLSF